MTAPPFRILLEKYHTPLLLFLLFLSLSLRLYDLSGTPLGMHADEVSGAYNAYSILQTGRDEHGKLFPLYFEAFNDYKHPFLIYSMVPSLALFDLTPFGTRLPSVLFSLFGVIFFYLILKELFDKNVAILGSFFLSFMPWYFHYSRLAFEVMSFCFLFLLGLLLFLRGFQNKKLWYASSVIFGISLYAYGIARLFIPLFLLGCLWIYRDLLFPQNKKTLLLCIFFFLLIASPAYYASFFSDANARFSVVSIFHRSETPFASFFVNYFSHFSPSYLFFTGDAQIVNAVTNWGELYHFALFFLPLGFFYCWKQRKERSIQILFLWIVLFPFAASFTYGDLPHSARSMIGVPLFSALTALGVLFFFSILREQIEYFSFPPVLSEAMTGGLRYRMVENCNSPSNHPEPERRACHRSSDRWWAVAVDRKSFSEKIKTWCHFFFFLLVILIIVGESVFFFHDYFFVYKETSADHWLAFAKPTVAYMEQIKPNFEHVYLSKTGLDLFYISILYYIQADPALYQKQGLSAFGYEICDFEQCFNESQKNVYVFRGFEVSINGTHNINYHTSDKIAVKFFETQ